MAHASAAQEPEWFTTAPVAAIRRVLERAGLAVGDIDLFEINEAFAVVALACMRDLGIAADRSTCAAARWRSATRSAPPARASLVTLLSAMEERGARRGCAAICIGGGEATAMVVERERLKHGRSAARLLVLSLFALTSSVRAQPDPSPAPVPAEPRRRPPNPVAPATPPSRAGPPRRRVAARAATAPPPPPPHHLRGSKFPAERGGGKA